jgi:hypothetical protein
MSSEISSVPCLIEWLGRKKPTQLATSDLNEIRKVLESSNSWPASITIEWPDPIDVFEYLAPLSDCDLEETKINGISVVNATTTNGTPAFVPVEYQDEVEVLVSGSSSWLSGGPCVFEQHESILKFNDLFWVNTSGDSENEVVSVGRFADDQAGLQAAVIASTYCSFLADGTVHCELDEWPQDE